MHPADPRADPTVVDLIELAGLWLAAGDWLALRRTLALLEDEMARRFPAEAEFAARFSNLRGLTEGTPVDSETIRKAYRRATVG
jgi:hypothetical protein